MGFLFFSARKTQLWSIYLTSVYHWGMFRERRAFAGLRIATASDVIL